MGYGVSSSIIKWVNFLTLGLSFSMLGVGIWLSTKHGDCDQFLTVPVLTVGIFILIISLLGFVGAWKDLAWVLCVYLVIMFFLLAGLVLFTAFAFVITNEGAGRAISGQGFKEYSLGDYSGYIRRLFNNPHNWKHLRDCLLNPDYCAEIARDYHSIAELASADLNSIQSGCCRPPAECRFRMINVTYYDLICRDIASLKDAPPAPVMPQPAPVSASSGPPPPLFRVTVETAMTNLTEPRVSQSGPSGFDAVVLPTMVAYQSRNCDDPDCIMYENDPNIMCFQCNSCKAGVAQFIKTDWRLVAMINIAVLLFLVALYTVGCCARRNALGAQYTKKREVETETIGQSRRKRSPFSSAGRMSAASHDEEEGPEPQVRCWQTITPGDPEDLIPVQSICPMRAPWSNPSPLYQSRKRPLSTKRHGKKKMPRLEGQTMVPGKRPRTGEKEQLEHPVLPFGAARRVDTVLNYEDSKTRAEKLLEQLPPVSAADTPTPSMSDVSPALQYDIPSTSDWFTTTQGGQTPAREIQVERELSQENEIERGPKDGTSMAAEPKKIPSEKTQVSVIEKSNVVPAPVRRPFGAFWRPKSTLVVHQNALFDRDEKKQHSNTLFEEEAAASPASVDKGPKSSDKTQHPAAPTVNKRRGWRKFTPVHNVGKRTLVEEIAEPGEGKDREPSCKVEMPSHTDVIVELLDDLSEVSKCVQDHLKELDGIRIHVRDSGSKIVSLGYDASEDPEKTQGGLKELEGFHIRVRDSAKKEVYWGDDVSGTCVQEPEVLRIHVSDSERRLVSRGDKVQHDSAHAQLKEAERPRTFARDSERSIVTRSDDVSEPSLQEEELRVRLRDSERRIVSTGDCVSEEKVQAGFKEPIDLHIQVRDTEKRKVSWGDHVSEESVKGELNKSLAPRKHLKDSERRIVSRSDDTSQGNVQRDLKGSGGLHIHVTESERRIISTGDYGPEDSVQGELKASEELHVDVAESARRLVSRGDDRREENVQDELQESKGLYTDADGQEQSLEEEVLHVRSKDSEKSPISRGDDISTQSGQKQLNKGSSGPRIQVRDSEKRIVSTSAVAPENSQSVLKEPKESRGLPSHESDPSYDPVRYTQREDKKKEENTQREIRNKPWENKRRLETVGEGAAEQLLSTPSANYQFSEPKLSRAISPILGSVKQTKVKSAGEESRKRGVSQYVFDPPKISRPTLQNQGEPSPKPEQERPKIVLEEPGPLLPTLEEKCITDSVKRIRPKSAEKTQVNSEEKPRKNFMDPPSKSREETQAKLEQKPLTNSLKEPLAGSLMEPQLKSAPASRSKLTERSPRESPFKGPQQTLVEEAQPKLVDTPRASSFKVLRPKLEETPPRASPSKEPPQKLVEEPRPKLEERPAEASYSDEPQRQSGEEPGPKPENRTPRSSPSYEPQRKSKGEKPPSSSNEARQKSEEEPRWKFEERPRSNSSQKSQLKVEGRPPRPRYLEEPRPKSIYDRRSELVAAPQPTITRDARFKSVEETQLTIVEEARPNSGDELRSKLVTAHRPKSVKEPRPTVAREQRPKYVEEYRPKPIDTELHDLDTSERGESSTRRNSRKRKEKPQKPD